MTETAVTITREDRPTGGRFIAHVDGVDEPAEMTFSRASPTLIIIDHTGVPDAMRGMGIGRQLVEKAVVEARETGTKIIPLCPFAKAQIARHPEWQDVLQDR